MQGLQEVWPLVPLITLGLILYHRGLGPHTYMDVGHTGEPKYRPNQQIVTFISDSDKNAKLTSLSYVSRLDKFCRN